MASFHILNFGCRATQADGAGIERQLAAKGMVPADSASTADVIVLNTCTVTASADQDARAAVRRVHRENPEARIVVTGCYAQRAPEELRKLDGVAEVVGNSHKHLVAEVVTGMAGSSARQSEAFVSVASLLGAESLVGDIFAHTDLLAAPVFEGVHGKTRPNLKIQDGCNNRCSFCVIPFVRGRSRSLSLAEVVHEVRQLEQLGYREVVLSGINLGRWGRDLAEPLRFEHLVRAILSETGIQKLRLSSVEPMDWSGELMHLMAESPRICKHAHLPLQSGSDAVLRRMHRKYRPWHYAAKIERIRELMPDAAIGADVMVGFPGETEAEFEETRSFIASLPFTYLHVFTYSSRPGTPSAAMPQQVPVQVARERNRILRELAAEKNLRFRESFVGRAVEVITLSEQSAAVTEALSDNYLKVQLLGEHRENQLLLAEVESLSDSGLLARSISRA